MSYCGGCSVHWKVFSAFGRISLVLSGDTISILEAGQYIRVCSVEGYHSVLQKMFSTMGDIERVCGICLYLKPD